MSEEPARSRLLDTLICDRFLGPRRLGFPEPLRLSSWEKDEGISEQQNSVWS
jgi:hypothetical protein